MKTELPVVYVRGYAGTTSGINRQVDDPFYGFNLGSTHVRVGGAGDPMVDPSHSDALPPSASITARQPPKARHAGDEAVERTSCRDEPRKTG